MRKLLLGLMTMLLSVALYAQQPDTLPALDTARYSRQTTPKPKKQSAQTVLICLGKSSYAYHARVCGGGLSSCRSGTDRLSLAEAKNRGYLPCKKCY